jgi:hypothetical protein
MTASLPSKKNGRAMTVSAKEGFIMAKKMILALILAMAVTGGVFAQGKNAVAVDVAPLAKGIIASDSDTDTSIFGIAASFEHPMAPHYSIGARMDLYAGKVFDIDGTYFGLSAHGRWYPLSATLEKLYLDAGLGFNSLDSKLVEFGGLTFALKTGWKLLFKEKFFAEPSLEYILAKSSEFVPFTPLGWQIGLGLGMNF